MGLASLRDQDLSEVREIRRRDKLSVQCSAQSIWVSTSTSRDHRSGQGSTVNCLPDTPHILLYTTPTTPTAPTAFGYNIGYALPKVSKYKCGVTFLLSSNLVLSSPQGRIIKVDSKQL